MKPPAFEYQTATTVEEAVGALAAHSSEARIIAGGQSLMPMLSFRLLEPAALVDINRVPGLDLIEPDGVGLRIGALVRHHALDTSDLVRERFPMLSAAMRHLAHLATRKRSTIDGSLSHSDPAAKLPTIGGAVHTVEMEFELFKSSSFIEIEKAQADPPSSPPSL